jgi:osmotically-inducible protein OsmY
MAFTAPPSFAADAPPDAWLTTKAKLAVLTSIGTDGSDINVDTVNGIVTLHGTVASSADKQKAEEAASDIDGVKDVRNMLQVVASKNADAVAAQDDKIQKRVTSTLDAEESLRDSNITVQSVNKGAVLLAGEAKSVFDHLRAVELATTVEGVRSVASEIQSPDAKADAKIWSDIQTAGDHGKKEEGKGVIGSMTSAAKKAGKATEEAAEAASGAATDAYITSATKARLLAEEKTPGLDINVDTENGVVTLFGTVPSADAKRKAEAEARKVSGVRKVENELVVKSSAGSDAAGITAHDDE